MAYLTGKAAPNLRYSDGVPQEALPGLDYINQASYKLKTVVLDNKRHWGVRAGAYLGFRLVNVLSIPANMISTAICALLSPTTACCGNYFGKRFVGSVRNLGDSFLDFPIVFEARLLLGCICSRKPSAYHPI